MKKMINTRNSIIVILCITIICISIGFIILSVKLKSKSNNQIYKVVFSEIKKSSSIKGSSNEPTSTAKIINNSSEIAMNFNLYSIHDEIIYNATIKNEGTIPVEIIDIMESPNYKLDKYKNLISPITITLTDVKGKTIEPNDTLNLKIIVYYNPGNTNGFKSLDYKLGLITKSK